MKMIMSCWRTIISIFIVERFFNFRIYFCFLLMLAFRLLILCLMNILLKTFSVLPLSGQQKVQATEKGPKGH
jgi:hypothetical protein